MPFRKEIVPLQSNPKGKHYLNGILRLRNPFVRTANGKRTFSERYLSVLSNFATLNLSTEVMQRSVCVGVLYPINIITRRGLACVAYSWKGAMRRPESRDKHREITPTPFSFPFLHTLFTPNGGVRRHRNIHCYGN